MTPKPPPHPLARPARPEGRKRAAAGWPAAGLLAALLLLTLLLGHVSPLHAQDGPPALAMTVEVAFDGHFKYGEWLPLWVQLENNGPDLQAEIQAQVTSSQGVAIFAAPVSLPTGSRKRIPLYVLPNNFSHRLEVRLMAGPEQVAAQEVTVSSKPNSHYFVGLIAPQRGALALLDGVSLPGGRPKQLVDLALTDLPERPQGLGSFDCLILDDIDTSTLTPEQQAALAAWVSQGGRLVIGGGAGARRTVAGLPESLLPLTPGPLVDLQALPALADFAASEPIRVPGPFVVASSAASAAHTLAQQDGLILIGQRPVGSGYVDFIALSLTASPFDAWPGATAFWERLLSPGAVYPGWLPSDVSARQLKSNQIVQALYNLPVLDLPSIRGLGLLLILYVALVGPANYLLLRRGRRLHWAWVTTPLITLLFSAGAFGLGYALRGSDLILNRIAVIALDNEGVASVSSYLGLFSPGRGSYEIEILDDGLISLATPQYDPWQQQSFASSSQVTFLQGQPSLVRGLAVNQWSLQTFMIEGVEQDIGRVGGDLRLEGDALVGFVRNDTPHALADVVLILGQRFVRLGDLAPGQETPVRIGLADPPDQRFGPPLSYRLFEEQFSQPTFGEAQRQAQVKQMIVDSVLRPSSRSGVMLASSQLGGDSSLREPTLLGWLDEAPPQVRVADQTPTQQTTALLYASLVYRLPETANVSLPAGLISGTVVQMPSEGGMCGEADALAVFIGRGAAIFEFQMPAAVQDVQIETLKLLIGAEGDWFLPPYTAIYDWAANDWITLENPTLGLNVISDVANLVSADGRVQVRLTSDDQNRGGCLYVNLGLEGTR